MWNFQKKIKKKLEQKQADGVFDSPTPGVGIFYTALRNFESRSAFQAISIEVLDLAKFFGKKRESRDHQFQVT